MNDIEELIDDLVQMSLGKVFLVGLFLAGVYWGTLYDDGDALERRTAQVKDAMVKENAVGNKIKKLKEVQRVLREEIVKLGEEFELSLKKLPYDLNQSKILKSVDMIAKAAGVKLIALTPASKEAKKLYEELKIRITLEGKFRNLLFFLTYISKFPRIIRAGNIEMNLLKRKGQGLKLTLKGSLTAYRYMELKEQKVEPGEEKK